MKKYNKLNKIYVYPAVFTEDNDGYSVVFPGIEGAFTCGGSFEEAFLNAKDCLELNLETVEEIPKVSNPKDIKLGKNEYIVMIQADMISYRKRYNNRTVKKTLTIPAWLNDVASEKKINFSKVLQRALEKILDER